MVSGGFTTCGEKTEAPSRYRYHLLSSATPERGLCARRAGRQSHPPHPLRLETRVFLGQKLPPGQECGLSLHRGHFLSPVKPQEPRSVPQGLSQHRAWWGHPLGHDRRTCHHPAGLPRTRWAPSTREGGGGVLAVGRGAPEPPPPAPPLGRTRPSGFPSPSLPPSVSFAHFVSQRKGLFTREPEPRPRGGHSSGSARSAQLHGPSHGFCFINDNNYQHYQLHQPRPDRPGKDGPLTTGLKART